MIKNLSNEQDELPKSQTTKGRSLKLLSLIAIAAALIALGFLAGAQYQKGHNKTNLSTNDRPFNKMRANGHNRNGARGLIGVITTVSDSGITINNLRAGTQDSFTINAETKIVINSQSTRASSLHVGDTVIVRANQNDKNLATSITLKPQTPKK
ncbi:MAG: hypothetical protein ABI354_03165 [Candidatus Saccharimonadales bacterium]